MKISDSDHTATFLVDAQDGKIIGASERALQLYGYPHIDFINTYIHDHFLEEKEGSFLNNSSHRSQQSFSIQEKIRTGAGSNLDVLLTFSRMHLKAGPIYFTTIEPVDAPSEEVKMAQSNPNKSSVSVSAEIFPEWQIWLDQTNRIVFISPNCFSVTGYTAEQLRTNFQLLEQLLQWPGFPNIHPEISESRTHVIQSFHRNGRPLWLELSLQSSKHLREENHNLSIKIRDVTEQKIHNERFAIFQQVAEQSLEGVILTDARLNILSVNDSFCRLTGYSKTEACQNNIWMLYSNRDTTDRSIKRIANALRQEGKWSGKLWLKRKSGQLHREWMHLSAFRNHSGKILNYIGVIVDPDMRSQWETRFRFIEKYDSHTLLPNRESFLDALSEKIEDARLKKKLFPAIVIIDLEKFRLMNNSLGFDLGDRLLLSISERLVETSPEGTVAARLGGDEFGLIIESFHDEESEKQFLDTLTNTLQKPHQIEQDTIFQKCRINYTSYNESMQSADHLLQICEENLLFEKLREQGASIGLERNIAETKLEAELKNAIQFNELEVYYQPQFDLNTKKIIGMEALVRWNHPTRGLVLPSEFIPFAEQIGLIEPLGQWVLEEVAITIRSWLDQGLTPPLVAVNFSAVQIHSARFVEKLEDCIIRNNIETRHIEIEITETTALQDLDHSVRTLQQLRRRGFQIAIDDFGTGYSSLIYLKRFPCQNLKVDRFFVEDIDSNPDSRRLLKGIIGLAHGLDLRVTAEGIETESQLDFLRDAGCHFGQGFFLSRPMPREDVEKLF